MVSAKVVVTVVAASLTGVSSVLGNLLLILACLNKVSGKVNVFLINLCVTDILLTAYTPVLGYCMVHGADSLYLSDMSPLCFLSNNHIVIASTANCATILLIAFERYIAIHQPLKYHQIMARDRMMQLVTICWISIIGATVLKDVVMWKFDGGPRYNGLKGFCVDGQYNTMLVKILVETLMCGVLLLIPLIVTTVLYSIILLNIYRNGQRFLSLRHKRPTDTSSTGPSQGHVFSELLQKKSIEPSENTNKTTDTETDQVIAELRDLTKNVDVKTISQSIRRCQGNTPKQNNVHRENPPRNRRVLKKQGTVVDFNNILSEEEFQDILENLKKFKNYCDEPNNLLETCDESLSPKTKSELSGSSLISRIADGKRECNLRKFHSFESLSERSGNHRKSGHRHIASANNSIRPANRTNHTPHTAVRLSTEDTCVCSSFCSVSEDIDSGNLGVDGMGSRRSNRNERVLERQYGRDSSSDTLIGLEPPGTPSIHIRPPATAGSNMIPQVSLKITSQDRITRVQPTSPERDIPLVNSTITPVTGASRWKHAAAAVTIKPDQNNAKTQIRATTRRELPVPGAASHKWKSAAMTLRSMEQTSVTPGGNALHSNREVQPQGTGTESSSDNWRMLILMMRLAKLAKQPSTLLQEKLGTTKYQIQLVKAALMSCVAFYVFTLPFVIVTVLPSTNQEEGDPEPAFPILILPLVNCLADFLVYGFMHPTIRHQVQNLLLRPRTLARCCSSNTQC